MSDRHTPETDALAEKLIPIAEKITEFNAQSIIKQLLTEILTKTTKLERERDEALEDLEFRRGLYKVQEECLDRAKRERDEAQAQVKLADTPKTDAYQYADYILNHYDRNSHMDKLCLAKSLVENGYGSKSAEIEAL